MSSSGEENLSLSRSSAVSFENKNSSRIACLLMEEGTRCAQETVLMHLPEQKTLAQVSDQYISLIDQ